MIVPINNEQYTILLSDTAGQEEYDRLRPLAYADVSISLKVAREIKYLIL